MTVLTVDYSSDTKERRWVDLLTFTDGRNAMTVDVEFSYEELNV